jgi:tetratricopeptide (TPR) repeat protein
MYYWMHFDRSRERVAKAKEAAEKAFRINPESPEAHTALGYYYYHCELDYEQALKHFMLALGKQPNNTEALEGIGYVKRRQGKFEETVLNILNRRQNWIPVPTRSLKTSPQHMPPCGTIWTRKNGLIALFS